jgi:hypothetical protein
VVVALASPATLIPLPPLLQKEKSFDPVLTTDTAVTPSSPPFAQTATGKKSSSSARHTAATSRHLLLQNDDEPLSQEVFMGGNDDLSKFLNSDADQLP